MRTAKIIAASALFFVSTAGASTAEKALFAPVQATCSCKGKGDCTCPKGQCKCKNCGNGTKAKIYETLKGTSESTQLPDTARLDARGGTFI